MPNPDPAAELAEMKARHLAQAREAQTLALTLMRAAAKRAEQALADPAPAPAPDEPQPRPPDHCLEFARLSRALHQAMAFEARTLADAAARPRRPWRLAPNPDTDPAPDPRRELIRQPLHHAIRAQKHPDQAHRLREIDHEIDQRLAADPAERLEPGEILEHLAQACGLALDPKHYSDELLGLPRPTHPLLL